VTESDHLLPTLLDEPWERFVKASKTSKSSMDEESIHHLGLIRTWLNSELIVKSVHNSGPLWHVTLTSDQGTVGLPPARLTPCL